MANFEFRADRDAEVFWGEVEAGTPEEARDKILRFNTPERITELAWEGKYGPANNRLMTAVALLGPDGKAVEVYVSPDEWLRRAAPTLIPRLVGVLADVKSLWDSGGMPDAPELAQRLHAALECAHAITTAGVPARLQPDQTTEAVAPVPDERDTATLIAGMPPSQDSPRQQRRARAGGRRRDSRSDCR